MTFEKVKEIIVDSIGRDEGKIAMEVSLVDDLGMDSLDAVELNMALEEAFDISIPDDVLASFVTVEDVVNYIDSVNE
jgi:acyl carrier protein